MRFYGVAGGRPTVLFFYGTNKGIESLDSLVWFSEALSKSVQEAISVFAVNRGTPSITREIAVDRRISFPILSDANGSVCSSYGVDPRETMTIFVLGPNLKVIDAHLSSDRDSSMQRILTALETIPQLKPVEVVMQAPVLLVPEVLEGDFCEHLIEVWRTQGNAETGVEHSSEGRREDSIVHGAKHRRDHVVVDEALLRELTSRVGRRLMPEIRKAFSFRATRFEGFKVACYDAATGGYFSAHRDNLSPSTAHRRFALTLNLNEEYEGGHLRFPEYGPNLYRPGMGGALVFSAFLLHEVLKVTKGQRFVLLSFLYGEGDVRTSRHVPDSGSG